MTTSYRQKPDRPPDGPYLLVVGAAESAARRRLVESDADTVLVPDVAGATKRAGEETDGVVVVHQPPTTDATAAVERLRASLPAVPVVAVLPAEDPPPVPAHPATDHVRRVGDWVTDLLRRVDRLQAAPAREPGEPSPAAGQPHETTLDRVTDGFYRLDGDWRFVDIDDHAAAVLGLDPEGDRDRVIWEVFPGALGTAWEAQFRRAMRTEESVAFEQYVPQLGAWFEVYAYPDAAGLSVYFRDVTERKEREAELKAYEQLFENVDDKLFLLDDDCRFDLVTEPLAAWLGHDRASMEGRPVSEFLSPTALARAEDQVVEALASGDPVAFETEVHTEGGTPATAAVDLTPLDHGDAAGRIVGSVRDVTDRRTHERRHDALVDNVPGVVYRRTVEDPTAASIPLVDFVSESYEELTGRRHEHEPGRAVDWLSEVVHPADRDRVADLVRRAVEGREPYTATYRITTPAGTRWVRDRAQPVTGPDGDLAALEGLLLDVTERKRRDRHQQVLTRVLRHDLRNAVQAVLGFASEIESRAAEGDLDPETAERMAGYVVSRGERLVRLSERAREVEAAVGSSTDEVGTVDAASVCREVASEADPPDGASLAVDTPETARVRAEAQLRRAVEELVDNAFEHAEEPTVRVAVANPDREGWVAVRVADDGPGLPERERAVLSGECEITQLVHGRGLGLWLVKWLVESYGGEVRFEVEDGTTVTLLLRRGTSAGGIGHTTPGAPSPDHSGATPDD